MGYSFSYPSGWPLVCTSRSETPGAERRCRRETTLHCSLKTPMIDPGGNIRCLSSLAIFHTQSTPLPHIYKGVNAPTVGTAVSTRVAPSDPYQHNHHQRGRNQIQMASKKSLLIHLRLFTHRTEQPIPWFNSSHVHVPTRIVGPVNGLFDEATTKTFFPKSPLSGPRRASR